MLPGEAGSCQQPLAGGQQDTRALSHTPARQEFLPRAQMSVEVDPSPVKPPDENIAWPTPGQHPWGTLSRGASEAVPGLPTYRNHEMINASCFNVCLFVNSNRGVIHLSKSFFSFLPNN